MRVVLSVDMEGISQLADPREIFSAFPEYWQTGKRRIEADTVAAAEGLLEAGATEVVVLDNHGSGNPENVSAGCLPQGARLETWNLFDVPEHGVDAMLQVGYHARGGVDGFLSHTYVPGLRFRVDGELISESHGRAWAAGVPLIGIVGNDRHRDTLGSLAGTPYLAVQRSLGRGGAQPVFGEAEGLAAIRRFAAECAAAAADAPAPEAPAAPTFRASMPNAAEQTEVMRAAGWAPDGPTGFAIELLDWSDARQPLAVAMNAAVAPLLRRWVGATSPEAAAAIDPGSLAAFSEVFDAWAASVTPEWVTDPGEEAFPP
jgi:D-amino peptidase